MTKLSAKDAAIDIVLLCGAAANDEERYYKVRAKIDELLAAATPVAGPAPTVTEFDEDTLYAMVNAARDEHIRRKGFAPVTANVFKAVTAALSAPILTRDRIPSPDGLANLHAILNDQPFLNSALSVVEIQTILKNEGGFMPDEAVAWFRTARGNLAPAVPPQHREGST